ncbi:hypothetical protein NPIL_399881 [Nephila pilipes]|uniref:Uncharacterized protein n=1 Tax=Nephila pilipes TaxID=299642 RepID=A0A8X6PSE3_NEPPI|nr:hypothetical protein NPIL_399881 [Nephila pilipes]
MQQVNSSNLGIVVLRKGATRLFAQTNGTEIVFFSIFRRNITALELFLNKVGEEELLIHTFGSKVPTRIKCARVQVKIRDILDKDEVIIEALEIDEVTSAPLEFVPIDIINELNTKGINLWDVDYGVFGNGNISVLIGAIHYINIVSGKIKHLNPKLVAIESKFGWLLMENIEGKNYSDSNVTSAMTSISFFVSGSSIENLWKLDKLDIIMS